MRLLVSGERLRSEVSEHGHEVRLVGGDRELYVFRFTCCRVIEYFSISPLDQSHKTDPLLI